MYGSVIADVFTDTALEGNPLAVVPDAAGLSAARMQRIAREMNLSETTFVFPPTEGGDVRVRIFTPVGELPFAGHPTFGTAAVLAATGRAILAASSVADMARDTGMSPRALQRWFARHVGMPPRRYLRLLRFQKAFETVPGEASLAAHAAEQGFADQAHMAREFRAMAGVPAKQARKTARGPFLT